MSELQKLLAQKDATANPANSANPNAEISNISKFSSGSYTNDKLREIADSDWLAISADPAQFAASKAATDTAEKIQRGEVPAHYTARTKCRRCGEVAIFPGCPPSVWGCPWCFRNGRRPRNRR